LYPGIIKVNLRVKGRGITLKDIEIEDKLCAFIRDLGDDLCCLELLLFFSRHPHARFNRTAVLHATTGKQFDNGIALKRLIEKKIVVMYHENGISLFALTQQEPVHTLAAEMINIDQRQWQRILEQILNAQGLQET
jgi:hypothetical protein